MKEEVSYEVVEADLSPLPSGFLAGLPQIFATQGQTIYKARNEIKNFVVDGRTVCVKKYGLPPFLNRVLYSWGWRTPKAKRTYENATKILERGFKTPAQWGYIIVRRNGLIGESYSVGEFAENSRTVGQDKYDDKLIRAFAKYTADLHAHGLMHRDYILNNILYKPQGDGYAFILIDINRFVFKNKPIRGFLRYVNLMQPFSSYHELDAFTTDYIDITHASPYLRWMVLFCRWGRNRYSQLKRLLKRIPGAQWFSPKRG